MNCGHILLSKSTDSHLFRVISTVYGSLILLSRTISPLYWETLSEMACNDVLSIRVYDKMNWAEWLLPALASMTMINEHVNSEIFCWCSNTYLNVWVRIGVLINLNGIEFVMNYRIIIVNTVQCGSICRYLLPLHISVSWSSSECIKSTCSETTFK
jgi:hypothetical protein